MSFSCDWLELREPADMRARNLEVLQAVSQHFQTHKTLLITDIACGAGSTLMSLNSAFAVKPNWTLVDYDRDLLERAADRAKSTNIKITAQQADLNIDLHKVLETKADLITCSAFLDLVSETWLDSLIAELKQRKLPFYAALSYDGRITCEPQHEADLDILKAVNQHQLGDKGFGEALGPKAAKIAIDKLKTAGFKVVTGQSDWQLPPNEGMLQAMLIDGWAHAVDEMQILSVETIEDWRDWRITRAASQNSSISVGHVDVFASFK
jgi:Methyltransferase domain